MDGSKKQKKQCDFLALKLGDFLALKLGDFLALKIGDFLGFLKIYVLLLDN